MTYQLYGYAPDPESLDEFDDLEEAEGRCEELVHEEGYDRAEVWDTDGELVYSAGRRPAVLVRAEVRATAPSRSAGAARARHAGAAAGSAVERERPIPVVRAGDWRDADHEDEPEDDEAQDDTPHGDATRDRQGTRAPAAPPEPRTPAASALLAESRESAHDARTSPIGRTSEPPDGRAEDAASGPPSGSPWVLGDRTTAPTVWFGGRD